LHLENAVLEHLPACKRPLALQICLPWEPTYSPLNKLVCSPEVHLSTLLLSILTPVRILNFTIPRLLVPKLLWITVSSASSSLLVTSRSSSVPPLVGPRYIGIRKVPLVPQTYSVGRLCRTPLLLVVDLQASV